MRLESRQAMRIQEPNRLEVSRDAVRAGILAPIDGLDGPLKELLQMIRQPIDNDPSGSIPSLA